MDTSKLYLCTTCMETVDEAETFSTIDRLRKHSLCGSVVASLDESGPTTLVASLEDDGLARLASLEQQLAVASRNELATHLFSDKLNEIIIGREGEMTTLDTLDTSINLLVEFREALTPESLKERKELTNISKQLNNLKQRISDFRVDLSALNGPDVVNTYTPRLIYRCTTCKTELVNGPEDIFLICPVCKIPVPKGLVKGKKE